MCIHYFYIFGLTVVVVVYVFIIVINSYPPSAAYMRQWTGSALVQVMACHLFGAKPFPEPMLAYCQLDSWEQISLKFESEFYHFHSRKCIWNSGLSKWQPFCPMGDELSLKWNLLLPTMYHLMIELSLMYILHSPVWLTLWGWEKMNTIFEMIFSNWFSWFFLFWFRFHLNVFPVVQLSINQHWFR